MRLDSNSDFYSLIHPYLYSDAVPDETGYNMLQVKSYIQNGKRNLKILIEKRLSEEMNKK